MGYEIERRDLNNPRWVKVNKDPVRNNEFTDEKVSEGHQYEYRISAVNAAGTGPASDTSHPIAARPMREPPKLNLDGLLGRRIKVRAGEPINIEIPLSGAPTPAVKWTKDDKTLPLSNRISVSS